MGRILALDIGERRIGVAVSDSLNAIAQGIETIERKDIVATLNKIKTLVKDYGVEKILVGLPINMDGTRGAATESMEEFAILLEKEIPIKIETIDERLTTKQSERMLIEADVSRKKRRCIIDKIAAQLILQTYLDSQCTKR